ncbi:MAG: hypothetical protein ACI9S8_000657 [Chlamydiales bacterium]|jgi:hypothetical protein
MSSCNAFFNAKIANLSLLQDLGDLSMVPYRHLGEEWLGRRVIEVKKDEGEIFLEAVDVTSETASRVYKVGVDILMLMLIVPGTIAGTLLKSLCLFSSESREVYGVVNEFFHEQVELVNSQRINLLAFLPQEDLDGAGIETVYTEMQEALEGNSIGEDLRQLGAGVISICEGFRERNLKIDNLVREEAEDKRATSLSQKKADLEESYKSKVQSLLPGETEQSMRIGGIARHQAALGRSLVGHQIDNFQNEKRLALEIFQAQLERNIDLQWIPQRKSELLAENLTAARGAFQNLRAEVLANPVSVLG